MRVIYSSGARFAGGGIGNIAYHAVSGLYRHGMLARLICGSYQPTEIPASHIVSMGLVSRGWRWAAARSRQRWATLAYNRAYDRWSARHLLPCDLFHVWGSFGLHAMERARRSGAVICVERASTHPLTQARLLREAYERWDVKLGGLQSALSRAVAETDAADFVLIPSEFVRQSFLDQGVSAEKLILVPFGVDSRRFHPLEDSAERPFRVLFVGQVGVRKGVPDLFQAWELLRWHDAELWIVGNVTAEAVPLVSRWRDAEGVRFISYTSKLPTLYQQCDVFAFPSVEEGSAMVTYEAMACGLPLLTTANAGSVARHGQEGLIVPPNEPGSIAECLELLRADDSLRARLSAGARRRAEQFSWQRYQDTLAAEFHRAASVMKGRERAQVRSGNTS